MEKTILLKVTAEISPDLDIFGLKEAVAMRLENLIGVKNIEIIDYEGATIK